MVLFQKTRNVELRFSKRCSEKKLDHEAIIEVWDTPHDDENGWEYKSNQNNHHDKKIDYHEL